MLRWGLAVMAVLIGACLERDVTECDGWLCPANEVCDVAHEGCVLPDQLEVCGVDDDGTACDIGSGEDNGVCDQGVCISPFCGDGLVTLGEDCDGANLGAADDCTDHDYYDSRPVSCTSSCRYDLSACTGRCGDGVLDVDHDEACDSTELDGKDCTNFGFQDAAGLACSQACTFLVTECTTYCGDGLVAGDEECDGTNLNGTDCTDRGFYEPDGLVCNEACAFVTTACHGECGDDSKDPVEDCDGTDLDGLDCTDFGFYDATGLTCTGCGFNVTACTGTCGDDVHDVGEYCDGAPPVDQYCTDYGFDYGRLGCTGLCSPDFASCGFFGWRQVAASSASLWGVWASGPNDVFASGSDGAILHYDGVSWSTMDTGTTEWISGLHGTGPDDVWAAAGDTVLHYDGTSWTATPFASEYLMDAHANAPDDVWVVGNDGVARHYDGSTWTLHDTGTTRDFHSVWASGSEVFATVQGGGGGTEVHRYDGATWTVDVIPRSTWLADLWGSAPDDVYAIDQLGESIWHYDGAAWSAEPIAFYTDDGGVAGSASDDVWAVGNDGAIAFNAGEGRWIEVDRSSTDVLQGVASAGPGDYFAIGTEGVILRGGAAWAEMPPTDGSSAEHVIGDGTGQVLRVGNSFARFDGTRWNVIGTAAQPVAVAVDPAGVIHAGGSGILEHDGTSWTEAATPLYMPSTSALYAPHANALFAVTTTGVYWQVAGLWTNMFAYNLNDISGTSLGDVWVVGASGASVHWDGLSWTNVATGVSTTLLGVWARTPGDVIAVGAGGVIRRWNATSWSSMASGVTTTLRDVWGTSATNLYAVGDGGTILHYDGSTWSPMTSTTTQALHDLWGRSATEIYAVGAAGTILRFDGTDWTAMTSGVTSTLVSIQGNATTLVAVGGGAVLNHTAATGWSSSLYARGGLSEPLGAADDLYLRGSADLLVHFDGATLTSVALPAPSGTLLRLGAIAPDDVYALTGTAPGPYTLRHYDGTWTSLGTFMSDTAPSLHVLGHDDVIVLAGTTVHEYDGTTFEAVYDAPIWRVWGTGSEVFAVGSDGRIFRRVGGTWSEMASPTGQQLWCVWGRSPTDVFAGGSNGTLIHFDGALWSPVRISSSASVRAITGNAGDLFLETDDGVLHLVGHMRPYAGP